MLLELEQRAGITWRHWPFPDYHAEHDGGISYGRTVEPEVFDAARLGPERARLRPRYPGAPLGRVTFTGQEGLSTVSAAFEPRGLTSAAKVAGRIVYAKLTGRRPVANGQALVARLRYALLQLDVPVWLSAPVRELIIDSEGEEARVVGVRITKDGRGLEVHATHGVVLATGGFSRSQELRDRYLPAPTDVSWSLSSDGEDGDGLRLGEEAGAELALTDKAWGFPTVILPNRRGEPLPRMAMWERVKPGTITVDGDGQRYFDEGSTYAETWDRIYHEAAAGRRSIPSWMVFDARAKHRYNFFGVPPGVPFPRWWMAGGGIHRSGSVRELAAKIAVPADALETTVARFNRLAAQGHDDDFGRGDTAWARFWGDGRAAHPNLGPIDKPPFYAVAVWPGELSTKGGVRIDERARALRDDGWPIAGLFACGNTTASIMGDSYPGGGGTIGPAMVMGYIAANQMASTAAPSGTKGAAEHV